MTENPDLPVRPDQPLLPWLARQTALTLAIALAIGAVLVLGFDKQVVPTLTYSLCISVCCSLLTHVLRCGFAWLIQRLQPAARRPGGHQWPGWPLMVVSLLLGTTLGYSAGIEIGNWLTGLSSTGVFNSSLRSALAMMLISLIPGLALTLFFLNRSRLADAEARAQMAQRQAAEHQLRLLEAQLEPHMLFNTLANLRVLITLDPPRAQAMLDQLISFLRATLTASRSGAHPLREEFARLQDYLALMQVRMGARLRPQLLLPPDLAELPVPPLLLQPLVENAIKHGLEPHIDGGELIVSALRDGAFLQLEVRDTGAGLQPRHTPAPKGTGFGLEQVRTRLQTQYGPRASLAIAAADDGRGGTRVRLDLPLPMPNAASAPTPTTTTAPSAASGAVPPSAPISSATHHP